LHLLLTQPCSQMDEPPQLMHELLMQPCSQMPPRILGATSFRRFAGTSCGSVAFSLQGCGGALACSPSIIIANVIRRRPRLAVSSFSCTSHAPARIPHGGDRDLTKLGGEEAGSERGMSLQRSLLSDNDERRRPLPSSLPCCAALAASPSAPLLALSARR